MSSDWRVRNYKPSDFSSVVRLLSGAFESSRPEGVRFSASATNTTAFVADTGGSVEGVAMTISFGHTAWIGSVVVSPGWRRRGVGAALTESAVELALAKADTVLLLALEPARRIYERLGFVDDGSYGTWVLPNKSHVVNDLSGEPQVGEVAALERQLEVCLQLDRLATGEDRRAYLEPLASEMRVVGADGSSDPATPVGYTTQLEWGAGPVIARDAEAGARLICDALARNPLARIEFPDANAAGRALVDDLGLRRVDDDFRMRLGPPVPGFRPQFIYKVLTPAVG